jgi:DNA-binding NarL/FixJ family response regulator
MARMTIRLAVVDDHEMVVEGLEAALARVRGFEVAARGASVADARKLLERDDLDVVLLDVRLDGGNGLQVLAARPPRDRPKVIVISSFNVSQYSAAAATFGASGFLLKSVPLSALVAAVEVVADGGKVFDAQDLGSRFVTLTPRQRDVVRLAMEGFSNKEIGARLGMHRKTVEAHLSAIFERYAIRGGRIELSIRAIEEGWLDIQPPEPRAPRRAPPGLAREAPIRPSRAPAERRYGTRSTRRGSRVAATAAGSADAITTANIARIPTASGNCQSGR